jgi:hypothetical protein
MMNPGFLAGMGGGVAGLPGELKAWACTEAAGAVARLLGHDAPAVGPPRRVLVLF